MRAVQQWAAAAANVVLLAAASAAAAEPPFSLDDEARIDAGRRRFGRTCAAYCHGKEGMGGRAPAFKGNSSLTPDYIFKTVTEGRRGTDIMPPWGTTFTPDEIWELTAYLMYLSRQPPP